MSTDPSLLHLFREGVLSDEKRLASLLSTLSVSLDVSTPLVRDVLTEVIRVLGNTGPVPKSKVYVAMCTLLVRVIEGNGAEVRDLLLDRGLAEVLVLVSRRPVAVSIDKGKEALHLQKMIWSVALALLGVNPLPTLEKLVMLREGAEIFLASTLLAPFESRYKLEMEEQGIVSQFVYPAFLCSDVRLLDIICRLVSKLADTDIDGASEGPLWNINSVKALLRIMGHNSSELRLQALLAIGNLLAGSDLQTDAVLKCGFLETVGPLVSDSSFAVRKESFWSLSNITAGSVQQIKMVLETSNIMSKAIEAFGNYEERQDIRNETAWLVCNALCGSSALQRQQMIEMNVLEACARFLFISNGNVRVSLVVVNGVEAILLHGADALGCWKKRSDNLNLLPGHELKSVEFLARISSSKLFYSLKHLLGAKSKSVIAF